MKLGQTIIKIRKDRNMTQEEFAKIFHVTRQTVSNWEKEKNYPDLETLIYISDEFNISLDVMLKEDKQMVKKLDKKISFSENFKKIVIRITVVILIALMMGAIVWGVVWNNAKDSLEKDFNEAIEGNNFYFDEELSQYKKDIDNDSYYLLPNQSMPSYFDFDLHYHAAFLDYYGLVDDENIRIVWSESGEDEEVIYSIESLDEYGKFENTFTEKQERELLTKNSNITDILKEGEEIYKDVYQ